LAKNVFKASEIMYQSRKVFIEPPRMLAEEAESLEPVAEYIGPTVEDLRREAEEFQSGWEEEKKNLLAQAREEAEVIKKNAEHVAFEEVKRKNIQAQKIRQEAEDEAERIVSESKRRAEDMEHEINRKVEQIEREASERGQKEGRKKGFQEGREEVNRLVERLHKVLTQAIDKRGQIIEEAETQVVNLVLLMTRKVIKVISENQKNVVINNVVQALRKLKSRGDVVIRVNLADLELTTEHTNDFLSMVENVKSISVLEDSSVDRGGCIIETDFGRIDARISSQIHEIEEKILELMPIRSKGE